MWNTNCKYIISPLETMSLLQNRSFFKPKSFPILKKNKQILVIEDHNGLRMMEGMFLKKYYNVVTQKDGLDGIIWLSAGNFPDLIVLDLMMPRLNGIEFLINIKSSGIFRDIPVIIVSGELGSTDYMIKPFDPRQLYEKIEKTLASIPA